MRLLHFLLGALLMLAGILIDSKLYAFSDCHYVKTHQRLPVGEQNVQVAQGAAVKYNNWITHDQMEAKRNAKWQARMKLVRDRKKEAEAVVAD